MQDNENNNSVDLISDKSAFFMGIPRTITATTKLFDTVISGGNDYSSLLFLLNISVYKNIFTVNIILKLVLNYRAPNSINSKYPILFCLQQSRNASLKLKLNMVFLVPA